MQVGDLVRYGSTTPENRTAAQMRVGTVLKDLTMWDAREPKSHKRFGRMKILWSSGRVEEVTFASLEVISEAR